MGKSTIISRLALLAPTQKSTATFTGDVYLSLLGKTDDAVFANVTFAPCARTDWHTHEHGQHIAVTQGQGWLCDLGEEPRRIVAGDVIWAEPGTTHWHGADKNSIMSHTVAGFGETRWLKKVTDEEYAKAR